MTAIKKQTKRKSKVEIKHGDSREYTMEEVREKFIRHVWSLIDYWERESNQPDVRDKLEGLAHSIFATLDGCTSLPAFIIAPMPHKDDKQFNIDNWDNYYPENKETDVNCDIGPLHEYMYQFKPKHGNKTI